MKICVISDTHDRVELLHAAIEDAKSRGAERIIHCGDVVAPYTLKAIRQFELPMDVIHGNNKGDLAVLGQLANDPESLITYHGRDAVLEIANQRLFMVHFPNYARAIAQSGEWDVVCCGHNHRCKVEQIQHSEGKGSTQVVNPGSASGMGRIQPSYILGDLERMEFEILHIPEPELAPYKPCGD